MYVEVDREGNGEALREQQVFDQFKVVVVGAADDEEAVALAAARFGGRSEEGRVWVPIARVRELAGERARDPEWAGSLDGMVAYADSKGWVDDAEGVRAHVERS